MTPDQLRSVVGLTGTGLDLPLDALGSPAASAAFGPFLPTGRLVLRDVTGRAPTPDGIRVTGVGNDGPFAGMAVTAEFTAGATDVTVVVTAAGDESWSFAVAFPPLKGTLWEELRFQQPQLLLDSATPADPDDPLAQIPMTFTGTMIVTTQMALLDLLFSGVRHDLTGEITPMPVLAGTGVPLAVVPSILLFGPDAPGLDLGLVSVTQLQYELYAMPRFNFAIADYDVAGRIVVSAAIPFTAGAISEVVALCAELSGWDDSVLLRADFSELGNMSLADVAEFARKGQGGLAVPFDGVAISSPVVLSDVSVLVTAGPRIGFISLTLETQEEWTITDLIDLQQLDVVFRISDPLGKAVLTGVVAGLVGIGENGTLDVVANFGERSLGGALREDDGPLSIREVFSDATGQDPGHFPDLVVKQFDFYGILPKADQPLTFQAVLGLEGDWQLTEQISLTSVGFDLAYAADFVFIARATFVIGGFLVAVSAGHDPVKGWQFTGETMPGQAIPIGAFFADLAAQYGTLPLPAPIARLVIENLAIVVSSGDARLYLTGEAVFPIDTVQADIVLAIDTAARVFTPRHTVTVPTAHGSFTPRFDIQFAGQQDANLFTAVYSHSASDPVPQLKDLVAALLPSAAAYVPDGLTVDLRDAFIAVTGPAYLFGADLMVTIDFSQLPVIGDHLDLGVMGFDPLRLVAVSAALTEEQVKAINGLLPEQVTPLPDEALATGFRFDGLLKLGALERPLDMPVTDRAAQLPAPPGGAPATKDINAADNTLWYKVQRSFGPIYVDRVGVAYLHVPNQSAQIAVLLDASLTVAGLTLSLTGLEVGLRLSDPAALPTFDLAGLGLSYAQGPVEITGSFLKDTIEYVGNTYVAYGGQAVIRTTDLSIGAIGSYLQLPEGPSLFVYAFLDHALGGPAFFFVRGLAAGFGYNRRLIPPTLDTLADFPLISEAVGGVAPASSLAGELQRLDASLIPSPGDMFLTVGIHFTSFEMIDSFLLLVVSFGHRFELDLLGLSTLTLPAADSAQGEVTPVAHVQLALRATFVPDDGVFSVTAQLTPDSFLLSRDCHLFGGFAFFSWFSGKNGADSDQLAGDFVLTVGGYHPHFNKPAHYPAVPRLRFLWQVSPQLQLTGSAYYALTPSALMAGGSFSATYQDDSLRAWFDASMDFLISWQPYHYEANLHVAIGASYTFELFGTHTITVHVGADVNLWGPDFGGTAYIDLSVISFTIAFGAQPSPPKAIDWSRFRQTLLPAPAGITTIALSGGALASGSGDDLGVVDPHALELRTDSVIPSSSAYRGPVDGQTPLPTGTASLTFGVSPLGLATTTAVHRIEISNDGGRVDHLFGYTPVTKRLPCALWGGALEPSLDGQQLTGDLLAGYTIRPLPPQEPASSPSLPASALEDPTPLFTEHGAIAWGQPGQYRLSDASNQARAAAITSGLTAPNPAGVRAAIADAVLKGAVIDLNGFTAAEFLQVPQVMIP
jgi:hypothetical protein